MNSGFDASDGDIYDEFDDDGMRWMSLMVVVLVIFGFFSLAWYAYHTSSNHSSNEEVLLIKADKTDWREAPKDPGGMDIPHQDKTVYETVTGVQVGDEDVNASDSSESPLVTRDTSDENTGWIKNKSTPSNSETIEVVEANVNKKVESTGSASNNEDEVAALIEGKSIIPENKPKVRPEPQPQTNYIAPKPKPKPVVKAKPKPVAASKPSSSSAKDSKFRVQLASLKSHKEAEKAWGRFSKQHSDLLGDSSHVITKVTIAGKGTYYRVRAGGFDKRSGADQLCKKLKARGLSCLVN